MTQSIIPAFSTGIVSEELASSTELDKVRYGLKECSNMIITPLGGVKNRPGTEYIAKTALASFESRLMPFEFNELQAYVLEQSHLRMRVIKDGGLVLRSIRSATYKWTLSASGTGEYHLELAAGGDPGLLPPTQMLEDSAMMTEGTLGSLVVSGWGYGDNDTLGYNTPYARITGSTDPDLEAADYLQVPYMIDTPYQGNIINELESAQSADTLFIAHGDYSPYKITRTDHNAWTVTEIHNIDGPYKARVTGDEDVKITAVFISSGPLGEIWEFTADTAIFDDVVAEVGEPIRLGFPVPGEPEAIHWNWFLISVKTSGKVIRAGLQGGEQLGYQQVVNPVFKNGIAFWEEYSDTGSSISYNSTDEYLVFTDGAGDAKTEQSILTLSNKPHHIFIDVDAVTGAVHQIQLSIGTTSFGSEIFGPQVISAQGDYSYAFLPTDETIFISITSNGSTAADTISLSRVEVWPDGDTVAGLLEHTTTDWRLASWNSTHGYPKNVTIKDQRIFFAGNDAEPDTIWVSKLGNFEDFGFNTPGVATDAFSFLPATTGINGIGWMAEYNGLKIGTAAGIWSVFATSGGAVTPTDVNVKIDSSVGSLKLPPITVGNSILITPRGFTAVSEITSSFEASGFVPRDITVLASHLFENRRIVKWAFARDPDSVVWCVLDDGTLLGVTYVKEYDIYAWHTHSTPKTRADNVLGDSKIGGGQTAEGFLDVAVIPNSSDDNIDDVYFLVNRTKYLTRASWYIEKLSKRITPQTAAFGLSASGTPYDYRFLDSALTLDDPRIITGATQANPVVITSVAHGYSDGDLVRMQNFIGMIELNNIVYKVANKAADTYELTDENDVNINGIGFGFFGGTGGEGESRLMVTTVSGLDHLEGETVTALADGAVRDSLVVSSGAITLPVAASFVHVGLPYVSEIETLYAEILADTGSTQGRIKSLTKADIYFKDSRGVAGVEAAAGSIPDIYWPIDFEDESTGEDPPGLFTGVKEVNVEGTPSKNESLKIRQTDPLPIHILRAVVDVEYDR